MRKKPAHTHSPRLTQVNNAKPAVRKLAVAPKKWHKPSTWRRPKPLRPRLPKARSILKDSLLRIKESRRALFGITAVYGLGVVLLVRGFSASQDFETLRVLLDSLLTGAVGKLKSIGLQLTFLFGGGGNENTLPNASLYQTILLVICSLALIWVFRQSQAKQTTSTKAAFYRGMYPLVPFVLIVFVIGLQLLPFAIGSYVYSSLVGNGILVHTWERLAAVAFYILNGLWSLRMVTASMFALYIVTLPEMTPMRALRSAKELVRGRRLVVWRKLLLLPAVLFLGTTIIVLPFLLFLTPFAVWVFFLLSTAWFAIIHSYLYSLYRELLNNG